LTIALPNGARTGTVRKVFEKSNIVSKWEASGWAKKRAAIQERRKLNDFGRFTVLIEKKRRRDAVRKALLANKTKQ
jgi:large subunit ribosomal protein L14e